MLLIHAAAIEVIRAMTAENKILLLENNLTDSLNIDELEEEIFQSVLALGRNILQRILEKRTAGLPVCGTKSSTGTKGSGQRP